jgi:rubrerythrin
VPNRVEQPNRGQVDDYVEFLAAGVLTVGEFHCAGCGYGVTVHGALPTCPMCSASTWEQAAWSPFTRAARAGDEVDA